MLENAAKKVREATYFCWALEEKRRTVRGGNTEVLDFYLSAFLSAARSITFAMQAEAKDKYDLWWKGWRAARTRLEQDHLDFVKDQRNLVLKRGAADVVPGWTLVPDDRSESMSVHHYPLHMMGDWGTTAQIGVPTLRFASAAGVGGDDVIEACKKALALLEVALRDFVATCEG